MNFSKLLRVFVLTLSLVNFNTPIFSQNRVQIGLIYPMNNPVFDIETDFGTATSPKTLFKETYEPTLQVGVLTKKLGKFQMELKMSGNVANHYYYMEGIDDLNRVAPDTLFMPYEGDQYVYNTFVRPQDVLMRIFQLGYLFHYEFNDKLSLGSGFWLQHSRGDFLVYNTIADYAWDGDQYLVKRYENSPPSGFFNSQTSNIIADRVYKVNRWNVLLPVQARLTLPFKSENRLGIFAQANLGLKAQHYWMGAFWEF